MDEVRNTSFHGMTVELYRYEPEEEEIIVRRSKRASERGVFKMKVFTPGKIVPYKCAFLAQILALRRILTQMFFFTNAITHFQLLSVMFIEYGQNVNKQYFKDKAILGKMDGVYVTFEADVDKRQ